MPNDTAAQQARVRIWYNSRADYESPWTPIDPGAAHPFSFSLGPCAGDPVVDLQFFDSDYPDNGVNSLYYGGNDLQVMGQQQFGAWWQNLTHNSIEVKRGSSDTNADQAHVRVWGTTDYCIYLPSVMRAS
jgi:hypothetical protein